MHGTLKNLLRTAAIELQPSGGKGKQLLLPPLLARITLQYNCTVNATTKLTPFHVFFGRAPPPSGPPQLVDKDDGGDGSSAAATDDDGDNGGSGGDMDDGGAAGDDNGKDGGNDGEDGGDNRGGEDGGAGDDNGNSGGGDYGGGVDDDGDDDDDSNAAREQRLAHRPVARKELKDLAATGVPRPAPGRRRGRVAPAGAPQNLADDFELDDGHAQAAAAAASTAAASESGAMQMARTRQRLEGAVVSAAAIAALAPPSAATSGSDGARDNDGAGASSAAARGTKTVSRIAGLVWDRRFHRILYLTQYETKSKSAVQRDEFAPASDFGITDEQLQKRILKKGWVVAFIGGIDGPGFMGAADREEDDVVPVPDVVEEVERGDVYNDGQDPLGKDIDDDDGARVEVVESTSPPSAAAATSQALRPRSKASAARARGVGVAAASSTMVAADDSSSVDAGPAAKKRRQT